ncbi:MAG: hypothetical protein JNM98_03970 [Rhodocyclaceae bacterium]|nr:hypothetical protein [Rhodocyclaceae bacterium]
MPRQGFNIDIAGGFGHPESALRRCNFPARPVLLLVRGEPTAVSQKRSVARDKKQVRIDPPISDAGKGLYTFIIGFDKCRLSEIFTHFVVYPQKVRTSDM